MSVEIIAELGINHNGNLEVLKAMALAAHEAGADYVKIQKRDIDLCYSEKELRASCESPWGSTVEDKVRGRELSWDDVSRFDEYCKKHGIKWFASAFDRRSLEELNIRFPDMPYNKIPSAMAKWRDFVRQAAEYKKPLLISTGLCASMFDVMEIATIPQEVGCDFVLNHCIAVYPAPIERLNLRVIENFIHTFGASWSRCLGVGYSGHEVGLMPSVVAVVLGARWVERHFTLDRSWYGADQAASVEPQGFSRLVRDIRQVETILGDGYLRLYGDEKIPVRFENQES